MCGHVVCNAVRKKPATADHTKACISGGWTVDDLNEAVDCIAPYCDIELLKVFKKLGADRFEDAMCLAACYGRKTLSSCV